MSGVVHRAMGNAGGSASTMQPVPRQWVVLHRVGHDRAGPIDSVRTDDNGAYAFRYAVKDSAVYFASAMYAGIAYFTPPLESADVQGANAAITVFDTSSTGETPHTRSRNIVVFAPDERRLRHVSEVFWLENTTSRTRVSSAASPTWSSLLPDDALGFHVDDGDIAPAAVTSSKGRVNVVAPIAPGLRQLQISYEVPAARFPLTLAVADSLGVLEVLVEDSTASVVGATLARRAPVSAEGHTFQRFLSESVPPSATFTISLAHRSGLARPVYFAIVIGLAGVALLGGLARTVMSPGRFVARRASAPDRAQELAHQIAALDARFEKSEKHAASSPGARGEYTVQRDALKAELTAVLAERDDRL